MIQVNELRIGNILLLDESEAVIVLWVRPQNIQIIRLGETYPSSIILDLDRLSPIPLTKEWLLKFGFDICNTVGGFEKWELSNGFRLLDGKPPALKACQPVQYVHQLQNLYFALTQTELTLTQ